MFPRKRADDINGILELVVHDVLEILIVADDQCDVLQCILDISPAVKCQLVLPVLIRLCGKFLYRQLLSFLGKRVLHFFICRSKILHGFKRWEFSRLCPFGCPCILVTEFMKPYHIKRIHQLSAAWVCGMVAVYEQVIIDHDSGSRVRRDIVISSGDRP